MKNSYINEQEGFVFLIIPGCFILAIIALVGLIFIGIGTGFLGGGPSSGEGVLTNVPDGWNSLITDASRTVDVPPAMVAAIFLTEKHITEFGEDIDPEGREENCSESYAGAKGPWQLMPDWWRGSGAPLVRNAQEYGLTVVEDGPDPYVDVCIYRQGAIGGAYVIKVKMGNADIDKGFCDELNDDEVMAIAERYCGCCTCSGCGDSNFSYCEFALERYKSVFSSLTNLSNPAGGNGCFSSGGGDAPGGGSGGAG